MAFNWLPIVAAALLLVMLIGAVVVALGLRGRLVSRAPHCRRCRFDLSGLSLTRGDDASAPVCPECGRGIAGPDDVRRGLRRRSRGMIIAGCLLVLVPLIGGGAAIIGQRQTNWNAYKPDWWLMIEAANLQPAAAGPQVLELRTRLEAGKLGRGDARKLVERALAVQADRNGGWTDEWGDFVNAAAVAGLLSEAQLEQHARNAPNITVSARPRITIGDPLVIEVFLTGHRVGDAPVGRPPLQLATALDSIRIGDRTLPGRGGQMRSGIHPGTGSSSSVSRHNFNIGDPGDYEVVTIWRFSVSEVTEEAPIAEWTEERTVRVRVEPTEMDLIELVDDDALGANVRAAVSVLRGVQVSPTFTGDPSQRHVSYQIECRNAPVDLAFEVVLRERPDPAAPDRPLREWNTGRHALRAGGTITLGMGMDVSPIDVTAVDVVLRPSRVAAIESIGIYRIWAREIVIENVPVQHPPAAAEEPGPQE